jgi:hypothetical protein
MSCLGVLFSLDKSEVDKLKAFTSDKDRLEYLQEEIEETYFDKYPERVAELDKSWDALHRSLTNGKLEYTNGVFPLSHVVLGGELLYYEGDYIMSLKTPDEVKQITSAVEKIDEDYLKKGYQKIDANDYGFPLTDEDFEYTWNWLDGAKEFWRLAAMENRYVLFTADQ